MTDYPKLPLQELVRQLVKDHGARWLGIGKLQLPRGSTKELPGSDLPLTVYVDGEPHRYTRN